MKDSMPIEIKRIYIICSVRNRQKEEEEKVLNYVAKLEAEGCVVRCPFRDTDQNDEIGLRIVHDHEVDIRWADEIHVIWNPQSQGSLWDVAQARMAQYFMPKKKIILANIEEVEITRDGSDAIIKSYTNVLLATHFRLTREHSGKDLEKAKKKRKRSCKK